MNEIGLDPGIDHLSTMKVIDEVKSGGGEVRFPFKDTICKDAIYKHLRFFMLRR